MIEAPDPLTPAEVELVQLLIQGHTVKQSAALLGIEYLTARKRTETIRLKSGTTTTVAAVLAYCDASLRHMGTTPKSRSASDNARKRYTTKDRTHATL